MTELEYGYYECTCCGKDRQFKDGSLAIIGPAYNSSDGLSETICPICLEKIIAFEQRVGTPIITKRTPNEQK